MRFRWSVFLSLIALAAVFPSISFAVDPSKIIASCGVSTSRTGPFTSSGTLKLLGGSDLFVSLFYKNDDVQNSSVYTAHFTTTLVTGFVFGSPSPRTIDTQSFQGGAGLSSGTANLVVLHAINPNSATDISDGQSIRVTSDVTGTATLALCNFTIDLVPFDDDIDKDGIPNADEIYGVLDPHTGSQLIGQNGKPVADFPGLGANPCRKDIAIQVDYEVGTDHTHKPDQAAIDEIKAAFANASVSGSPGCPYPGFESQPGINLIIEIGDGIPERTTTDAQGHVTINPWDCSDTSPFFEPARRGLFRRVRFVHRVGPQFGGASGVTPCGDAAVVSLGVGFGGTNGSVRLQSGTFMHEFGHALGLGHGGDSGINLKPNYLSVMNYSFQEGIPDNGNGHIDYSRSALPELDEGALDENVGIGGPANTKTIWWGPQGKFSYPNASQMGDASAPLNWNGRDGIESTPVSVDVNSDGVCVSPGPNGIRETVAEGDDIEVNNQIFNGPNHVCDTRPCNHGVDGCDDQLASPLCVTAGPNGVLDTTPSGDDVDEVHQIVGGPNAVCDTLAMGDDFQFTMVGRTEPRLLGHDDWNAIVRGLSGVAGPGFSEPPHGNWTPEERARVRYAIDHAGQPQADTTSPTTTANATPAPNSAGWNRSDVNILISATDPDGVTDVAQIGYRASGPQPIAPVWVPAPAATVHIGAEGLTPLTYYSSDRAGNTDVATTLRLMIDKTPPSLTCGNAPDGQWHATDVVFACSATDSVSGLAQSSDTSFALSTNVAPGTETSSAVTDNHQVCDVAENCATAGPISGNKVDKKPPAIAITSPSGTYVIGQAVMANYNCSDGGSGVASCSGPVANGSSADTGRAGTIDFTVHAADKVANSASQSVQYTVSYAIALLYDTTKSKQAGSTVPIKLQVTDAGGGNRSSSQIAVTALRVVRVSDNSSPLLDDSGNANPDMNFRFDGGLGGNGGYIFNLSTKGFASGTYQLYFNVGGDPVEHFALFQLK
jgi:hypothetical protein